LVCDEGVAWDPIDRKMRLRDVALADMYNGSLQGCARLWVAMLLSTYNNYCRRERQTFGGRTCLSFAEVCVLKRKSMPRLSDRVAQLHVSEVWLKRFSFR
jgi:hypothetical protein